MLPVQYITKNIIRPKKTITLPVPILILLQDFQFSFIRGNTNNLISNLQQIKITI